jgi:hypothetical protein
MLPMPHSRHVGCSSGHFTTALAEICSKDHRYRPVGRMIEHAYRTANANGWDWDLYQPAEETGLKMPAMSS